MTAPRSTWQRCCVLLAAASFCAAALAGLALLLGGTGATSLTGRLGALYVAAASQRIKLQPRTRNEPSRVPEAQMRQWRQFAASRQCTLEESDYAQIALDLEPFGRAGGITEAAVAAAAAALPGPLGMLEVRGGRALEEEEGQGSGSGTAAQRRPRRSKLPWGGVGYYRRLMADFQGSLPDMKLLFNFGDLPRSWVAPLPPGDEAAMRSGRLSLQQAWERHGCGSSGGGGGAGGVRRRHGLFQAGAPFRGARGPLPVLSGWRVEGCFSDILVPHAWNNKGNISRLTLGSGCPLSTQPWQNKSDVAFWRGSSTGAFVNTSTPPEVWRGFQRQRLVELSRAHPAHLDAAFTRFVQCTPPACAAMEARYGTAPYVPPSSSAQFSHKYSLIVDGNGAAARLGPTLCSGSLALNAQLFREWFFFRLTPFKHFIPIRCDTARGPVRKSPDYSDLLQQIDWARAHDQQAQQMAAEAVRFVNAKLRHADLQCYLYRLLLEYGALYRPTPGGSTPQAAAAGAADETAGGQGLSIGAGGSSSVNSTAARARGRPAAPSARPP